MPQDELVGKMTGLAEHRVLDGTHEKKEGLPPMEKRAGDSRRDPSRRGVSLGCAERKFERQKTS